MGKLNHADRCDEHERACMIYGAVYREYSGVRESKAELTDRFRRDGQWEAFKRRRDQLKADGMPASDAWGVAADEFPPPMATQAAVAVDAVDLTALKGKRPIPLLDAGWITPADAPSPGAWSLREWARSNLRTRSEYYRLFAGRLAAGPHDKAEHDDDTDDAHDLALEQRLAEASAGAPRSTYGVRDCEADVSDEILERHLDERLGG